MNHHRAYRCHQFGDYHQLTIDELPTPIPGPHEVLIETRACAVAFHEMLMVQGLYQLKPPLPFTPGSEASGVVRALGRARAGAGLSTLRAPHARARRSAASIASS